MARARLAKKKPAPSKKKGPARKKPLRYSNCQWHGANVLFDTRKDGVTLNQCNACKVERAKKTAASRTASNKARALLPKTTPCEWHPGCDWWGTSGATCGYCAFEHRTISHALDEDFKKGLECTMTRDFLRLCIGRNCELCAYGPLLPMQEPNHPRKLSLDRLDNSKPHTSDFAQMQVVCWQCNKGKSIYSNEQFYAMAFGIVAGVLDVVAENLVAALEDEKWMKEKLRMKNRTRQNGPCNRKRKNEEDWVPFTLTVEQAIAQLRLQHHCCSLCQLALSTDDCSFDQTDAKNGYVAGKFTFMHIACNSFKGEWPIDVAIETARRAVAFKKSKDAV